jgi:ABC-2 type transport system ATP-binding protein
MNSLARAEGPPVMSMPEPVNIEVRSLLKRFRAVTAVNDLTFQARPGRITGFLGPNGAGKTTTLRVLLGLARPDAGTATVNGRPFVLLERPSRTLGAIIEEPAFHPGLKARVELRYLARVAGVAPARVEAVLEEVDLADAADRRIGGFSLGMRQRLGLAAALLGEPAALVLDEPVNGLDPLGIRWLRDLLRRFADAGGTVLVSSHLLAEIAQLADDIVVIHRGRLVVQGPMAQTIRAVGAGDDLEEAFVRLISGHPAEGAR